MGQEYRQWHNQFYDVAQLEVVKTGIIAERMNSYKPEIKNRQNNHRCNFTLPKTNIRKTHVLARRAFFDQYERRYAQYNINNNNNNNTAKSIEEYMALLQLPKSCRSARDDRVTLNNDGCVKQLVAQYTSASTVGTCHHPELRRTRKRSHITHINPLECPAQFYLHNKIPRLTLSKGIKMEQLESPRLVEAAMNSESVQSTEHNRDNSPEEHSCDDNIPKFSIVTQLSIFKDLKNISLEKLPVQQTVEIVTTDENGNGDNKVRRNILNNLTLDESPKNSVLSDDEPCKALSDNSDENGNSLTTENSNEKNETSSNDKLNTETATLSPEPDPSSTEELASMQTVIENAATLPGIFGVANPIKQIETSPDNFEWLDDSLDTLECSFQKELHTGAPWRYSSPINKNCQREDSMTEVINSINVNLTPSKSLQTLNIHLPETDVSLKYNLNSTHMSMLYSLTPTTDVKEEETCNEHINCGKECPECLILQNHTPLGSLTPDSVHDEVSSYIWDDDPVPSTGDDAITNISLDLNKTIDLFDNSIEMDGNDCDMKIEQDSSDVFDVLENLKSPDDTEFHKDIVTSVNEIIAGLGEREAVAAAVDIVDDVLTQVADLNLEIKPVDFGDGVEVVEELQQGSQASDNFETNHFEDNVDEKHVQTASISIDEQELIVIGELIHHIIDKNRDDAGTSASSPESFNLKKVKESANTEIKEMKSSAKEETELVQPSPEEGLGFNSENDFNQTTNQTKTTKEVIDEIKLIIEEMNNSMAGDTVINEELATILSSHSSDHSSSFNCNDNDVFQQYVNRMKFIAGVSDINSSVESHDASNSTGSTISINHSEFIKQFVDRCKKIINTRKDGESSRISDNSTEGNNLTYNISENSSQSEIAGKILSFPEENHDISSIEIIDEVYEPLSTDNDTKSDNSKEKIEITANNRISYCVIEYAGDNQSYLQTENSEENMSDLDKEVFHTWDANEAEIERSYNEIRASEVEGSSFIEFELVDDIPDQTEPCEQCYVPQNNLQNHSLLNFDETKVKIIKSALSAIPEVSELSIKEEKEDDVDNMDVEDRKISLEVIEEDEEISEEVDDDDNNNDDDNQEIRELLTENEHLSYENEEKNSVFNADDQQTSKNSTDIEIIEFSENESITKSSATVDFYSCKDSTPFDTGENSIDSSSLIKIQSPWSGEEIDELDSHLSTEINSEAETYTISDCDSEGRRETMYNADISTNLRRSDSFSTNDFNAFDTTNNMADISSTFDDLEKSRNLSSEHLEKMCDVCLKHPVVYGYGCDVENTISPTPEHKDSFNFTLNEQQIKDLGYKGVCRYCLMTLSMDTRDFIRLEREVVQNNDFPYEKLETSPLKAPPKYEDTTLCQVVTRITLTDSLGGNSVDG